MLDEMESKVQTIISDALAARQLELVELSLKKQGNVYSIDVLVDKPAGGITMDECASANKMLIDCLDTQAVLDGNYALGVSSPGLDRSLSTKKDFLRVVGRPVRIHLLEKIYDKLEHHGVVSGADEGFVFIVSQDQQLNIPLNKISKAVQLI